MQIKLFQVGDPTTEYYLDLDKKEFERLYSDYEILKESYFGTVIWVERKSDNLPVRIPIKELHLVGNIKLETYLYKAFQQGKL